MSLARDIDGRAYAQLSRLRAGDRVEIDAGFTCARAGVKILEADELGLFFRCNGPEDAVRDDTTHHYLAGQADDGEHCVGVYGPI